MKSLLHLVCLLVLAAAGAAQSPSLALQPEKVAIELNGKLDEADWGRAATVQLTQQSPVPGGATPYQTEVLILLGTEELFLGFYCHDPNPGLIAIHTMRRDGNMNGDDSISIALDTFGDHRTGYFFRINAAAARVDGLIADPESASLDWDGVWEARTQRVADGWTAEIKIPARTLSFSRQVSAWGINFERFVPRDRTTLRWTSATLDSFFYDLSRTGALQGVGQMEQGHGFEISPYATARTAGRFRPTDCNYQAALGGDISWRITPQLQSVFTVNTDFAETEVDSRQVNLTRFPLFFPEKRSFFLEGANQFQFGLGLGSNFIPFFSRRIGLFAGAQVPILAGIKVNGRIGKWNVGLLDVQARDATTPAGRISGTNLLAGRVSYDLTPQLRVGTIFTHGDPGAGRDRPLAGFDAVYRTSTFLGNKNFLVGAWTASSYNNSASLGSSTGWGYKIDYPNDLFDCSHTFNHFGANLDPALGFLPRPGINRLTVGCNWQPRPSKDGPFKWIRQEFFENSFTRVSNARGFLESWRYFMAPINVRFESGDRFEFNWVPTYEFLDQPFEIADGVIIAPGRYHFTRWRLEAETSPHRPFQFGHTTRFGTFYDGHLAEWENYLNWTSPRGKVQLGLSTVNDFAHLKAGNFVQRLWQLQSAYAWNPDLILTSFIQYDSESRNLGSNTRLRWTVKPGNDIFLIWNRGWTSPIGRRDLSLMPQSDLIAVKVRWTFRY